MLSYWYQFLHGIRLRCRDLWLFFMLRVSLWFCDFVFHRSLLCTQDCDVEEGDGVLLDERIVSAQAY